MITPLFRPQFAPQIQCVIDRLYSETLSQDPAIRQLAQAKGLTHDGQRGFYEAMKDARLPVTPEFGALLYILARSTSAQHIIEFGTSFGVSTLFLAAALRDNGGGRLVTSELLPDKAERASANLREAGLADLVDIRIGDARATLSRDLPESIDLILLDASKGLYLDLLLLLEPALRKGGLVISDRADLDGDDGGRAAAYLSYLTTPANGYRMASITTQALGQTFAHDVAVRA
ncbi:putative O-methyltransferase YrrM [Gluconobacter cerinus]|jgi:predicted O-methyltransferase YrrM|uniref:O-methyltransferase n=1 Tax=Gluconobacter cerinus TaxID=38307 RepID=UPI0022277056|nr:class I SAM-dependent methyltransferase [Gluconobacter cerinus]MCW2264262.1 putative O-methyltransferase YrrM [Gluconobacter cerinus]